MKLIHPIIVFSLFLSFNITPIARAATTPSTPAFIPLPHGANMSYIQNDVIKLGVDLNYGGAIAFITHLTRNDNMVNIHDPGRYIQQSYYAGPKPFGNAHPRWANWAWNPIGAGDVAKHGAKVLDIKNTGDSLYVKTIPMQWALDNVPGECTFEQWITLHKNTIHVRNRLNNNRPDKNQYPGRTQELPAVYTTGVYHQLATYTGDQPFTGAPTEKLPPAAPPWGRWYATENWTALLDDSGFGLGLYAPNIFRFAGGFAGKTGAGGPHDGPTGHISAHAPAILDHNITFDYQYDLIVGNLKQIREFAIAKASLRNARPNFQFKNSRQGFTYRNATDQAFPITGPLKITPTQNTFILISPQNFWLAKDTPTLNIRAAFPASITSAQLIFTTFDDKTHTFPIPFTPDNKARNHTLDFTSTKAYQGPIKQFQLRITTNTPNQNPITLHSITSP